ncbi:MAG: crossover junction endodeoxyribonuclease RuvC, partial [Bacteroidales bacterium]
MKTLSLDLSTTSSGWAIFDEDRLVEYGCIKAKKEEKDFRFRIKYMLKRLDEIIEKYNPDKVVCEDVPLKKGTTKVTLMLGCLQGAVLGLCASHDLYIDFIPV